LDFDDPHLTRSVHCHVMVAFFCTTGDALIGKNMPHVHQGYYTRLGAVVPTTNIFLLSTTLTHKNIAETSMRWFGVSNGGNLNVAIHWISFLYCMYGHTVSSALPRSIKISHPILPWWHWTPRPIGISAPFSQQLILLGANVDLHFSLCLTHLMPGLQVCVPRYNSCTTRVPRQ